MSPDRLPPHDERMRDRAGIIIGRGDVASAITNPKDGYLYFASGVSNSQETRESEYEREIALLMEQPRDRRTVYFGSLSIFYGDGRYQQHKREMEARLRVEFPDWNIVRLGNISWGTNPHTLINHFRGRLERREPLDIRDATRYMIDQAEFEHWVNLIPEWNCEMNITGQPMTIEEIVKRYVL